MTDEIQNNLKGLCRFGNCFRLAGKKMEFDLLYKKAARKGFIDYSHIDGELSESDVLDHINFEERGNYPGSFFIAHSMSNELKTKNYFNKRKRSKHDPKSKESEGISIYSVCYKMSRLPWYNQEQLFLQIVPLVQFDKPTGVLILIETNFLIPKI